MRCAAACLLSAAAAVVAAEAGPSPAEEAYRLLAVRCVSCHGAERADGGIRLDRPLDIALVVSPRRPDASHLVRLVLLPAGDPLAMPPAAAGPRLTRDELDVLRRWIAAGADPPAAAP